MTILEWTLQWTTSTGSLLGMTVSSSPSGLNGLLRHTDESISLHTNKAARGLWRFRRILMESLYS